MFSYYYYYYITLYLEFIFLTQVYSYYIYLYVSLLPSNDFNGKGKMIIDINIPSFSTSPFFLFCPLLTSVKILKKAENYRTKCSQHPNIFRPHRHTNLPTHCQTVVTISLERAIHQKFLLAKKIVSPFNLKPTCCFFLSVEKYG